VQLKRRESYRTLVAVVDTLPLPIAEEIIPHIATLLPDRELVFASHPQPLDTE
jgi:hypothetical protein